MITFKDQQGVPRVQNMRGPNHAWTNVYLLLVELTLLWLPFVAIAAFAMHTNHGCIPFDQTVKWVAANKDRRHDWQESEPFLRLNVNTM